MKNKVAYITGGTKGIGLAIAEALLREGVSVGITSRSQASADKAADKLAKLTNNHRIIGIQSDVTSLQDESRAIGILRKKFGSADIVVANAGIGIFKPIYQLEEKEWRMVIDTNLTGVFNTTKASFPDLKQQKGYLFTISSLAGTNFFPNGSAYNASKFGVVGFTQAVMLDMRKDDIKVTTIMPGSVATYFNGNTPSDEDMWKIQPEDIGTMIVQLLQLPPRTLPSKIEVRPSKPS